MAVVELALILGGLTSSHDAIGPLVLWAALVAWPLWWVRHPAFLLIWAYTAVVGYLIVAPWLTLIWMTGQHVLNGRVFC